MAAHHQCSSPAGQTGSLMESRSHQRSEERDARASCIDQAPLYHLLVGRGFTGRLYYGCAGLRTLIWGLSKTPSKAEVLGLPHTARCPLWVKSGLFIQHRFMSALPPIADMRRGSPQCLLIARSGLMARSRSGQPAFEEGVTCGICLGDFTR